MINIFFYFVIFILGLAVGSFLNCVIYRLEKKESFLKGRSYCPDCKHQLSWQDLIPVFSFIFLRGKCRYCQKKISIQYPLVEIATGLLFVLIASYIFFPLTDFFLSSKSAIADLLHKGVLYQNLYQNLLLFLFLLIFVCFMIVIFVYDLKHFIIPDKVIYPAIILTFVYRLFWYLDFGKLLNPLFSAILSALFFLAIFLISRGKWLGFGDVKLAFLMGLLLGFPSILVALFLSFLIGAIIGVGLIMSGKKTLKSEVPFGPFLVTGTFIALFWGKRIIERYLALFL